MRKRPWLWILALIPLVAIGFGVQYWLRMQRTAGPPSDPALTRAGGTMAPRADEQTADSHGTTSAPKPSAKGGSAAHDAGHDELREETSEDIEREERAARASAAGLPDGLLTPKSTNDGVCHSLEYRGEGLSGTKFSDAEWAKTQAQFTAGREALLAWLQKRRKEIPDKAVFVMENQLKSVQLEKPPVREEPDLSWRGIGVFTYDSKGAPRVRLGGGFVKLVAKEPKRAQFELTRLLAQVWAPCELQRLDPSEVWSPLLDCMKVSRESACAPGSAAEEGWAVSSALAAILHSPGCNLPGLSHPDVVACLEKLPLPLTLDSIGKVSQ